MIVWGVVEDSYCRYIRNIILGIIHMHTIKIPCSYTYSWDTSDKCIRSDNNSIEL